MRYTSIPNQLFIKNRKKLASLMEGESFAILRSSDSMPRSGDLFYPFRQSSDLFYTTGINQEKTSLVMCPSHEDESLREVLFILKPSVHMEIWEGKKLTMEEASAISGVRTIMWEEEFTSFIDSLSKKYKQAYLNKNENPRYASSIKLGDERYAEHFQNKYKRTAVKRLAPLLTSLRTIKEPEEIEVLRKACSITKEAFLNVLKCTKPGMFEYEIEAEIIHTFIKRGANGHAYEPIIAGGKNACYLHYTKNNDLLKHGDLLFMDFGAEYANYASDLSRAIPINGRFSNRQKDVYQAVLHVLKEARSMLRVSTTISEYHKEVCKIMEKQLIGLGLFTEENVKAQDPKNPLFFQYYMHGTSHFIGVDTHDVGSKDQPLEPGMVFSCEPGIYIPTEGIGIRLENDILITNGDPIDLMADIPIELEEIEELMNS